MRKGFLLKEGKQRQDISIKQYPNEDSLLWRLKVLIPLLSGYFFGAALGTIVFSSFGRESFLFPSIFIGVNGLVFTISVSVIKRYYGSTVHKIREVSKMIPLKTIKNIVSHQENPDIPNLLDDLESNENENNDEESDEISIDIHKPSSSEVIGNK
jgi:hypothetical protein